MERTARRTVPTEHTARRTLLRKTAQKMVRKTIRAIIPATLRKTTRRIIPIARLVRIAGIHPTAATAQRIQAMILRSSIGSC